MKGLGNYSAVPQVERKPAILIVFHGDRAACRFHDGRTIALPSDRLRAAGLAEGSRFMMVTTRQRGRVIDVRFDPIAEARPALERRGTPKMYAREGRTLARVFRAR